MMSIAGLAAAISEKSGNTLPRLSLNNGHATMRASPARIRKRWDLAVSCCDAVLLVLGLWLALVSLRLMKGPSGTHALVLGVVLALLSLVGLTMSTAGRDALSVRALTLVGLGFCVLATMQLMGQVTHDVGTHCALAEAVTRIRHMEDKLVKTRHDELITQLFFRMNEMDDMLSLVQQGAAAQVEAHSATWRAAQADKDYLRQKAGALRRHASAVADGLRTKIAESKNATGTGPDAAVNNGSNGGGLSDQLWGVERRLEAVDSVIRYLDSKDAAGDLSYDEYEIILEALLEGSGSHVSPTTVAILQQEKGVLPAVKAAFERQKAGHEGYAAAVATGAPVPGGLGGEVAPGVRRQTFSSSASLAAVTKAQSRKESSRRHFENRFMDLLNAHGAHHGDAFRASLGAALESLPEHCVRDVDSYGSVRTLGWALLAVQFFAGYAALTAFVHVAKKED